MNIRNARKIAQAIRSGKPVSWTEKREAFARLDRGLRYPTKEQWNADRKAAQAIWDSCGPDDTFLDTDLDAENA